MNIAMSICSIIAALILSPFLRSIINRTKAWFSGKKGPSLLQPYFDLLKLLRKGAVYSSTTTWLFKAGPVVQLATILLALCLMPAGRVNGLFHFEGDLLLFAYLMGLGRFFTLLAAMDTGSSFEGMGASREAFFSSLVEPGLLLGLGGLAIIARSTSLSNMYGQISTHVLSSTMAPALLFIFIAFFIIYLTENARIPVDDPTTHLELTMVHEVMILDHGGVDLAFIEYAGALKLWVLGLLVTGLVIPVHTNSLTLGLVISIAGIFILTFFVGVIESAMARFKLIRIPQFLAITFVLAALWAIWIAR